MFILSVKYDNRLKRKKIRHFNLQNEFVKNNPNIVEKKAIINKNYILFFMKMNYVFARHIVCCKCRVFADVSYIKVLQIQQLLIIEYIESVR